MATKQATKEKKAAKTGLTNGEQIRILRKELDDLKAVVATYVEKHAHLWKAMKALKEIVDKKHEGLNIRLTKIEMENKTSHSFSMT